MSLWQMLEQVTSDSKKKRKGKVKKMGKEMHENDRKVFVNSLDKLFDISSCRCPIVPCAETDCSDDCEKKVHIQCNCSIEKKIPVIDLEFIYDQRMKHGVHGKFQIAGVDTIETTRQNKALEREALEKKRIKDREEKEAKREEELFYRYMESQREQQEAESFLEGKDEEGRDDLFLPSNHMEQSGGKTSATGKWSGLQNREHFPRTVMAGMRGGVSQRTMANILSSFVVDLGLATKEDPRLLVDHRKINREQEREMDRVTAKAEKWMRESGIDAIQFDGKEEKAKAWVTLECGTKVVRHMKEDHITLTDGEGEFLMHFTREKVEGVRAARVIALRIEGFFKTYGINSTVKMIGADSTNTNTECKDGTIVNLERLLGRRLMWSICLLHTNELPLRHLIEVLDGPTGSSNTLTGPAGRLLPNTQSLPYNPGFEAISCGEPLLVLPPDVVADLSWDQQYGYRMLQALEEGSVPLSLRIMVIRPLDHSRWLTTANR